MMLSNLAARLTWLAPPLLLLLMLLLLVLTPRVALAAPLAVPAGAIVLDGQLDEYTEPAAINLQTPGGLFAQVWLRADDAALHVGALVSDGSLNAVGATPRDPLYRDDGLELLFADGRKAVVSIANLHLQNAIGDYGSVVHTTGSLNQAGDVDAGYRMEISVPWAALGLDARPGDLAFDLNINDRDAAGRRQLATWSNSDGGNINNVAGYGQLAIIAPPIESELEQVERNDDTRLTWNVHIDANEFRLHWGAAPDTYTDSAAVNVSVVAGRNSLRLADYLRELGVYYLALTAHKGARMSNYSAPLALEIVAPAAAPDAPGGLTLAR